MATGSRNGRIRTRWEDLESDEFSVAIACCHSHGNMPTSVVQKGQKQQKTAHTRSDKRRQEREKRKERREKREESEMQSFPSTRQTGVDHAKARGVPSLYLCIISSILNDTVLYSYRAEALEIRSSVNKGCRHQGDSVHQ